MGDAKDAWDDVRDSARISGGRGRFGRNVSRIFTGESDYDPRNLFYDPLRGTRAGKNLRRAARSIDFTRKQYVPPSERPGYKPYGPDYIPALQQDFDWAESSFASDPNEFNTERLAAAQEGLRAAQEGDALRRPEVGDADWGVRGAYNPSPGQEGYDWANHANSPSMIARRNQTPVNEPVYSLLGQDYPEGVTADDVLALRFNDPSIAERARERRRQDESFEYYTAPTWNRGQYGPGN